MRAQDGKNLGFLTIEDGGAAQARRTHAEREVERAVRDLFYAMEGKNKNMHNVAEGRTFPVRMLLRRFKDAKRARRDAVNYARAKHVVRVVDAYVDQLFHARTAAVTQQLHDRQGDLLAAPHRQTDRARHGRSPARRVKMQPLVLVVALALAVLRLAKEFDRRT